jgi:hypothetical protein
MIVFGVKYTDFLFIGRCTVRVCGFSMLDFLCAFHTRCVIHEQPFSEKQLIHGDPVVRPAGDASKKCLCCINTRL